MRLHIEFVHITLTKEQENYVKNLKRNVMRMMNGILKNNIYFCIFIVLLTIDISDV